MAVSAFESDLLAVPDGEHSAAWTSPSNIALVKYWGKRGDQLPANASISFTLSTSVTDTRVTCRPRQGESLLTEFLFEGKPADQFADKSRKFLGRMEQFLPWLATAELTIDTKNSFPHSSGIASSASGMSALALCLLALDYRGRGLPLGDQFYQQASFLARIGSGSACRSVYGGIVEWGAHSDISNSSDLYAVPVPFAVHPVFSDYKDMILLVDQGAKKVSSTVGHGLLNGHPFAEVRYGRAGINMSRLKRVLQAGDLDEFVELVEGEALMLHALMMTSTPSYILMKPATLAIIELIREFRAETGIPVCFTLDAGANVHVLYPSQDQQKVEAFVTTVLISHCENKRYLCDEVGSGPRERSA